ncbi:MAG: hypothetical protein WBW58_21760 [Candidatus Acidiferrum sp.]
MVFTLLLLSTLAGAGALRAGANGDSAEYVFDVAAPESVVVGIVKDIAADSVIRGTYVYEKEKTLSGAIPASSSSAFGAWQGPGVVFYKTLGDILSPRHFENSSDLGTITVRYVVIPESATNTRVRIDAVFVERARRKVHISDGTVETSEFSAIRAGIEKYDRDQEDAAEAQKERQDAVAKGIQERERQEEAARVESDEESVRNMEARLHELQHALELQVKAGGAEFKSAPFRSAANLKVLPAGSQVVVLILTPYWYGVATPDGQHGWLRRDVVEPVP